MAELEAGGIVGGGWGVGKESGSPAGLAGQCQAFDTVTMLGLPSPLLPSFEG